MIYKTQKNITGILIGVTIFIVILGTLYIIQAQSDIRNSTRIQQQQIKKDVSYSILLKENSKNSKDTDISLLNPETQEEIFFVTLSNIYRSHYHNSEYHNGNLYIIKRPGGEDSYETNPEWTDELWRLNTDRRGQKIFSAKGLDFRVSPDERLIGITTNEELVLLNEEGQLLKRFQGDEITINPNLPVNFTILAYDENFLWIENSFAVGFVGLAKINIATYDVTIYDFSNLPVKIGSETIFNPTTQKIAYSTYLAQFDVDKTRAYEQSGEKVYLIVYDINTKEWEEIATSVTKKFEPQWIGDNTLEYNNPNGGERLQWQNL